MNAEKINIRDYSKEFVFSMSRSSGPGGQNVNKVNSKVELRINIKHSQLLSENEKMVICQKLKNSMNLKEELIIVSQTERTQLLNKQRCVEKFNFLIANALKTEKTRKPSLPSRSSKERRLDSKRKNSLKKVLRRLQNNY